MAPVPKRIVDIRESSPGNIKVTPITIEPPIYGRPVLQSHEASDTFKISVNATVFPFRVHGGELQTSSVDWPVCVLLLILVMLFGVILSKWGWSKVTGRIWRWSSKWDGPLEMEDEEELLPENIHLEEVHKESEVKVNIEEIYGTPKFELEECSLEDWINRRPREICSTSSPKET